MSPDQLRPHRSLLIILSALCLLRLLAFASHYSRQALQMDFSAFYHAAATMRAGADPYRTQVDVDPALWDGAARYTHSLPLSAAGRGGVAAVGAPAVPSGQGALDLRLARRRRDWRLPRRPHRAPTLSHDLFLPRLLNPASNRAVDLLLGSQYLLAMLLVMPYLLAQVERDRPVRSNAS